MSKTRQKCGKNPKTPNNNTTTLFSEHLMMAEAPCIPNENNGFVHEMFIMIMITPLIIIMVLVVTMITMVWRNPVVGILILLIVMLLMFTF